MHKGASISARVNHKLRTNILPDFTRVPFSCTTFKSRGSHIYSPMCAPQKRTRNALCTQQQAIRLICQCRIGRCHLVYVLGQTLPHQGRLLPDITFLSVFVRMRVRPCCARLPHSQNHANDRKSAQQQGNGAFCALPSVFREVMPHST